jgi:hypothetical protein
MSAYATPDSEKPAGASLPGPEGWEAATIGCFAKRPVIRDVEGEPLVEDTP